MINITSPMQESICLDSFFGVTRILDSIFEELRVTYISHTLSQINTIYLCIIAAILVVAFAVGFYIVKGIFTIIVNIVTYFALKKIDMIESLNLCFITMGDYKTGKIHIYNGNNCLSMDEVNAVGIDPSSCELIYDKPLVPPKMASFNNRMLSINHGVFFAAMEVEAYSESSIFTGYKHPDISKKKLFNLGNNNPIYNSKYINLYIGQWKLDKAGRNIYELGYKPKFDVDKKDRKEFEKTFNDILSGGNGEITIKITGSDKYYEKSV